MNIYLILWISIWFVNSKFISKLFVSSGKCKHLKVDEYLFYLMNIHLMNIYLIWWIFICVVKFKIYFKTVCIIRQAQTLESWWIFIQRKLSLCHTQRLGPSIFLFRHFFTNNNNRNEQKDEFVQLIINNCCPKLKKAQYINPQTTISKYRNRTVTFW